MVPLNFGGMVNRQKNNFKYFQPKVKLKTEGLKKVLFNLKRNKEDLDQNLERLEPVYYTHIRAHEPTEHFVCPCLLVKYNKLHPYTHLYQRDTTSS